MRRDRRGMTSAVRARIAILGWMTLIGASMVHATPTSGAQGQVASSTGCDVRPRSFEDVTRLIQIGRSSAPAADSPADGASAHVVILADVQAVLMQFVA